MNRNKIISKGLAAIFGKNVIRDNYNFMVKIKKLEFKISELELWLNNIIVCDFYQIYNPFQLYIVFKVLKKKHKERKTYKAIKFTYKLRHRVG